MAARFRVTASASVVPNPTSLRVRYVGAMPAPATVTGQDHIVTQGYLNAVLASNITQADVDTAIAAKLVPYATDDQVDERDRALASTKFIDEADKTRLAKADLNKPGYPLTLDTDGKIPVALTGIGGSRQRYPRTAWIPGAYNTAAVTSTSEATVFTLNIPDPGFAYKVLVTGSVHGSITADSGEFPKILVYRDSVSGPVVAFGYGVAEAYQSPQVGSQASRAWVSSSLRPTVKMWTGQWSYTSDWLTFGWAAINSSPYVTQLSGSNYVQVLADMTNVTLSAVVAYSGVDVPASGIGNPSSVKAEIQIFSSNSGILATSPAQTGAAGTCTATVVTNVKKGDLLTVKGRQSLYAPWGSLQPGDFGTWAPGESGTGNTLTLTPAMAPGTATGEIPLIPAPLDGQSVIPAGTSTTLFVRIRSSGGSAATATTYKPYLWATPIPA